MISAFFGRRNPAVVAVLLVSASMAFLTLLPEAAQAHHLMHLLHLQPTPSPVC